MNKNFPYFIECDVENQFDIFDKCRILSNFIFRGHSNSTWHIESSFEREHNKHACDIPIGKAESDAIEFFEKRAHLYDLAVSANSKLDDILSTMQHYGCPTRLIDFTHSLYVATYFAVSDIPENSTHYSIWAINYDRLSHAHRTLNLNEESVLEQVALKDIVQDSFNLIPPAVIPISPTKLSRRMSAQQGVLLIQTKLNMPFLDNLCATLQIDNSPEKISSSDFKNIENSLLIKVKIIKFNFSKSHAKNIRNHLLSLNLTSEQMYPDLSGLAKSTVEHIFWK